MNFRFLLSLLFLLNLGLVHNAIAQHTSSVPLIDIAKAKQEGLGTYFSPKKCIQLTTSDTTKVAQTAKIIAYRGKLYTMSRQVLREENIKVFDQKNGSYLRTIKNRGRKSRKYNEFRDFVINPETNELITLASNQDSLMFFDAETGQYLRALYTGVFAMGIGLLNEEIVVYNNLKATNISQYHFLVFLDKDGKPISRQFSYFSEQEGISFPFTGFLNPQPNKTLLVSKPFDDVVYSIKNNTEVQPYIRFDLGPNKVNLNNFFGSKFSEISFLSNTFLQTRPFVIFKYRTQNTLKLGLYDLKKEVLFNNDGRDNFFSILTQASTVTSFKEGEITLALYPKDLAWMKIENPKLYQEYLSAHPMLTKVFESAKAGENLILITFDVANPE